MVEVLTIAAERRDRGGKGPARAIRRTGRVPGVIYGDRRDPVLVHLEDRALVKELHRTGFFNRLYDVKVGPDTVRVLPREVQLDPVTDRPVHADFLRVSAKTRVTVSVPLLFTNEDLSPGLKRGGVINVVRHEIEVRCLAEEIPESFTVDLDGLDIGDSVHISAVKLPDRVTPTITGRDFTIASIVAPTVQVEETPAAAATVEGAEGAVPAEGAEGAAPAEGAPAAAPAPAEAEKKPAERERKK